MASIETIRRVRVQYQSEGADKAKSDAQGVAASQTALGTATEAAAVVTETAARRQLSAAGAYQKVLQQLDGNARAASAYERALNTLNRAAGQGVVSSEEQARTLALIENRYGAVARAAQESAAAQKRAWSELGASGSRVLENLEAARKLGSLGMPGPANQNDGGHGKVTGAYRGQLLQDIAFQAKDFGEQIIAGSSPFRAALQQGPQAIAIAQMGGLGLSDIASGFAEKMTSVGEGALGLVNKMGLVGGAIGGITAILGTGVSALAAYRQQQRDLELSVSGMGRASGASVGQINAIAAGSAGAAGLSVSSARDMAGQFAATGKIGTEMYAGLLTVVKDYAATTRQELPEATRALAEAFADPVKGAETLNAQLGFLDAEMQESIGRFDAQGNRLGAQRVLFDGITGSVVKASDRLGFFSRQWQEFTTNTSNEFDAIGKFVDRGLGGGDAEQRLKALQGQLQFRTGNMGTAGGLFDKLLGFDIETIKADIAKVQAEIDAAAKRGQTASLAQRSLVVDRIVRGANPETERLKGLEDSAKNIRDALGAGVIDKDGGARRTMDGLTASAKLLREDMAAGGTAFADAIRNAQFGLRTVGFTPQGRSAAEISQRAENDVRAANLNSSDPLLRDYQVNSIRERARTELETLNKQSTIDLNAVGGAFSRMGQSLQQQIVSAANASGRIPAGIIAGIGGHESGSNPNVGYSKILGEDGRTSSAYGLGQITRGTAEEAVRGGYLPQGYDRTDPATMAQGIAGVLSMKMDQNGGSLDRAIMAYRGSSKPGVNEAYLTDVKRRAGEMGDASVGAQAKDADAYTRALRDQQQQLQNASQNYGKNGLALDANSEATRRYNALLDAGVPASDALAASIRGLATQTATAAQQIKLTQFASDTGFERDQLGRDRYDQGAYAKARATVGDTDSPQARFVIDQSRQTAVLTDARATFSDAFGGFAQDLRRGTSAAQAASNALGKLADKLLSTFTDSITSSLFGSVAKGGGGFLSGLFGGGKDSGLPNLSFSPFATGGIMTSHGPVPLNAYANGGIADTPQMALFGEGRMNEAYVPLPDGKRIPVAMAGAANSNSPTSVDSRSYNLDLRGSTLTKEEVYPLLQRAIAANNDERDRTSAERSEFLRRSAY